MDTNNNYCIYMHRNIKNNKIYIGQTCQKPEVRWGTAGKNYTKLNNKEEYIFKHFGPAIVQYGWDNFEHIIIADNLTHEEANELEIKLIEYYHTCDNRYGYNCQTGGSAGKPSNESRKHMSDAHKGLQKGEFHPIAKKVICLENLKIYGSTLEADREIGVSRGSIWVCVSGNCYTVKDLHWMYYEDYLLLTPEEVTQYIKDRPLPSEKISGKYREAYCGRKGVVNIITGEKFVSIKEAHDASGDNKKYITNCCKNGVSHIADNYWAYATVSEKDLQNLKEQIQKIEYEEKIILLETETIYKSTKEAAELLNLQDVNIRYCCNGHAPTYNNKHWMFLKNYDVLSYNEKEALKQKIIKYHALILCEETGKTYKKFIDAEKDTGIDAWSISRVCDKLPSRLTAGGLHWSFISEEEK